MAHDNNKGREGERHRQTDTDTERDIKSMNSVLMGSRAVNPLESRSVHGCDLSLKSKI